MVMRGALHRWVPGKGFGFIRPDNAGPEHTKRDDVFVHISELPDSEELQVGTPVEYSIGHNREGRSLAVRVRVIDE
jgi:cold shock CspA family protein